MSVSSIRLKKELSNYLNKNSDLLKLEKDFNCKLNLKLRDENIYEWIAIISGPINSPYEDGIFEININVPTDYPMNPPICKFNTKIFHPNIHFETGEICHELLKDKWLPSCSLETVCKSILDLISNPNYDSPLNCDAANLLKFGDTIGFYYMAKMVTIDYATKS